MKLQEAKYIKLGTTSVSKIMLGTTQVWPKQDNDHVLYGEVVDASQALPTISLDNTVNTPKLDSATNMFYLDNWSNAAPTSMSFGNKSNIKSIKKMQLDTSNVTTMRQMFSDCSSLTSLDLSSFNTSKVTSMNYMFDGCSALTSLDLSSFNTSKVTNMGYMFQNCSSLTSLDLSSFNTSKVTGLDKMFYGCSSLTTLNLSNWDTSNVNSTTIMFNGCSSLKDVYITEESTLNKLTNNLKSQGGSFIPSSATIHYNGTGYKWQDGEWTIIDNSSPVLYGEVADQSKALPTISLNDKVNTPKLYTPFNIFHLDTWSNASPTSISFNNKSNIKSIKKIKLDTSKVTDMNHLFYNCTSLTALNISNLNTSNVTNMNGMFANCKSLKSLDLSNFDTSNVTDMGNMFINCPSLKDVYITSNATLNKLTNKLRSQGGDYIPKTATIHYNGIYYLWDGAIWTNAIIEA